MHTFGSVNSRQVELFVEGRRFTADLWLFDDGHVEVREITLESGELVTNQPFSCESDAAAIEAAKGKVAQWLSPKL